MKPGYLLEDGNFVLDLRTIGLVVCVRVETLIDQTDESTASALFFVNVFLITLQA